MFSKIITLSRMIKIEHSIFALPFAYMGLFLAAKGWPGWRAFLFLTVAMVAVRSFAMAINRILDLPFDRLNPRTQGRELVSGAVTLTEAKVFAGVAAALFIATCAGLNVTCLILAPLALAWSALYSYTKRFTWGCHFFLGSVLGLAPAAGWLAVQPFFSFVFVFFGLGVIFWVAGFDILYACQDVVFDTAHHLHSIPARFGLRPALFLSTMVHVLAALFFFWGGALAGLGWIYFIVWAAVSGLLVWEHTLISATDLSRVNLAFFTLNGVVAVVLFFGVLLDIFI